MKKKTLGWAYLIILSLGTILSLYIPKNDVAAKDAIVIPGQAIRLRILANSDLDSDQALKRQVRDAVNAKISVWVKNLTSLQEARKVIQSKLPEIEATAKEVVKQKGSKQTVNVKFGEVQFPTKLYGDFLYPAGNYEAVLITLGAGKGANWWCVLFPPLCFLDFSNGIAVSSNGFEDKSQTVNGEKNQGQAANVQPSAGNKPVNQEQPKINNKGQQAGIVQDQSTAANQGQPADLNSQQPAVQTQADSTGTAGGQNANQDQAASHSQAPELASQEQSQPKSSPGQSSPQAKAANQKTAPVYTSQDEQPVQVKFFVVELWKKIFQ